MKKLCAAALFILFFAGKTFAGNSPIETGIMPFCDMDNGNGKSDALLGQLTDVLSQYSFFLLVERSRIEGAANEIFFDTACVLDDAAAVKAARLLGLKLIITGTVSKYKISARAILTDTGKTISSCSIASQMGLESLGKRIATDVEAYMAGENLAKVSNESPAINFEFWIEKGDRSEISSRGAVHIGETLVYNFRSSDDGYVTIIEVQPGGDVVLLFPNEATTNNKISKKQIYSLPSEENTFKVTVAEPPGTDIVAAFFTKKRIEWLGRNMLIGSGFLSVREDEKLAATSGLFATAAKLKNTDWESRIIELDVQRLGKTE